MSHNELTETKQPIKTEQNLCFSLVIIFRKTLFFKILLLIFEQTLHLNLRLLPTLLTAATCFCFFNDDVTDSKQDPRHYLREIIYFISSKKSNLPNALCQPKTYQHLTLNNSWKHL